LRRNEQQPGDVELTGGDQSERDRHVRENGYDREGEPQTGATPGACQISAAHSALARGDDAGQPEPADDVGE
jgi:hypothetical protein